MSTRATLFLFCGKMAAGKSTLAREIAQRERAALLVEDHFLAQLYPNEITSIADYARCSSRVKRTLAPHIVELLAAGLSVVLDFPGNTRSQRAWFRELIDQSGAAHELHFLDLPDELCKRQLRQRSAGLADGTRWTTDAEFDAVTAWFEPPDPDEGFNVIHHQRP